MIPDPTRKIDKTPILIEATAGIYRVHPGSQIYTQAELNREDSALRRFLAKVDDQRAQKYIVVLVHPNGIRTYKRLRGFLFETYRQRVRLGGVAETKSRIDLGAEPISDLWQVETGQ